MPRSTRAAGLLTAALALAVATAAGGQERQVYRYVDADGKVTYSDRAPPGDAKGVQQKRVGGNFIETSEPSYATRVASEKYPVTLYTFGCGDPCQSAEALLNARGVPFSKVNVEDEQGAQRLQALTGEMSAPVLQVGDKQVAKGYSEARWQALLDEAGYPKAPPRRSTGKAAPPPRVAVADKPTPVAVVPAASAPTPYPQ